MIGRERFSILVADESEECRNEFRDALQPRGFEVTSAGSGREAVDAIIREPVDLVVMDLRLPDYSGVEIYHAIKDIQRAFLPCIFTALEMSTHSLQDALSEDAITILPKPVDCGRLLHAVDWSIGRYYLRRRADGSGEPSGRG